MKFNSDLYIKKRILIYGLGVSGKSCFKYLKKNNFVKCFDDNPKNIKLKVLKKHFISKKEINKTDFDHIIISPGINQFKCSLKNYIKKNKFKLCTDLDVFYSKYFNNLIIGITGTNGKSTTSKLLNDILKKSNHDSRLVGNIGNAPLNEKKVSSKTIFVFEISSYQIAYNKIFKPNYGALLNISPDHLERHKTFKNYLRTKFKLIFSLKKQDFAFINKSETLFKDLFFNKKTKCKIFKVENRLSKRDLSLIKNPYFKSLENQENLSFVLKICLKLKIRKSIIFNVVNNFKSLNYRQQIVFNSKMLRIINDSKSTSFSSSKNLLNDLDGLYWILGGLPKKGDKFIFKKKKNIKRIYIYGKYKSFFIKQLKDKFDYLTFSSLDKVIKQVSTDIKRDNKTEKINLIFSPCAASFDSFKNFEDRGKYFNYLINYYRIKNVT